MEQDPTFLPPGGIRDAKGKISTADGKFQFYRNQWNEHKEDLELRSVNYETGCLKRPKKVKSQRAKEAQADREINKLNKKSKAIQK